VDGSFDAVEHFQVQLGKLVILVGRRFLDISQRRGIYNVTDNETLDSLILGDGLSSGNTSDTLDVTASMLVTSVIASFDSHIDIVYAKKFRSGDKTVRKFWDH
jgi:hypothetical protein